jgi:hypothetical protein
LHALHQTSFDGNCGRRIFAQALAAEPAARQSEALARLPEADQLSVAFSSSNVSGGAIKMAAL